MKFPVGMWGVALAWLLSAICCAPAAGRQLRQQQVPPPLPTVGQAATAHILANIQKLHQEASMVVAQQSSLINSVILRKESEARDAIEKEIPLASANDTSELSKDVAAQDAQLEATLQRSQNEAEEAFDILKDKTANAVNMSTVHAVKNVEAEAVKSALGISKDSIQLEAEAAALANEAVGAANFSQQAAQNSALWVKELPVKDAAEAVKIAMQSKEESVRLRRKYEDVKRMAKLSGNLALNTIKLAKKALAQSVKAKKEATLTAEQAAQNAQLLETIRQQVQKARGTAMWVVSDMTGR